MYTFVDVSKLIVTLKKCDKYKIYYRKNEAMKVGTVEECSL